MASFEPVVLIVLIDTNACQWRIAGMGLDGKTFPLMQSDPGVLDLCEQQSFDERVAFLRHRLAGVLQRGCDRLWSRSQKPCQMVFVADGPFSNAPFDLTQAVADHFVQWMVNPPVAFFIGKPVSTPQGSVRLENLAGEIAPDMLHALEAGLAALLTNTDSWPPIRENADVLGSEPQGESPS